MKKSEGNHRGGSGDNRDRGTSSSSSGSKRKQTDDESKDEEEMVDDETATNQHEEKGGDEEEDSIRLGPRITVRTKTHDGGSSSSQIQETEAEAGTTSEEREVNNNNNRMDAFARYSPGTTRRTRVSTEQHISTFLDNNNYQGEQRDRGRRGDESGKQF